MILHFTLNFSKIFCVEPHLQGRRYAGATWGQEPLVKKEKAIFLVEQL
jgi:hypothetical protein